MFLLYLLLHCLAFISRIALSFFRWKLNMLFTMHDLFLFTVNDPKLKTFQLSLCYCEKQLSGTLYRVCGNFWVCASLFVLYRTLCWINFHIYSHCDTFHTTLLLLLFIFFQVFKYIFISITVCRSETCVNVPVSLSLTFTKSADTCVPMRPYFLPKNAFPLLNKWYITSLA